MTYWWNVREVTPSGLKFSRAWHTRQFLVACIPPTLVACLLYRTNEWENNRIERELEYVKLHGPMPKPKDNRMNTKMSLKELKDQVTALELKIHELQLKQDTMKAEPISLNISALVSPKETQETMQQRDNDQISNNNSKNNSNNNNNNNISVTSAIAERVSSLALAPLHRAFEAILVLFESGVAPPLPVPSTRAEEGQQAGAAGVSADGRRDQESRLGKEQQQDVDKQTREEGQGQHGAGMEATNPPSSSSSSSSSSPSSSRPFLSPNAIWLWAWQAWLSSPTPPQPPPASPPASVSTSASDCPPPP